jgi:hypothetical protein
MSEPAISELLSRQLHEANAADEKLDHFAITFVDAERFARELHGLQSVPRVTVFEIYNDILRGGTKFLGLPVRVIGFNLFKPYMGDSLGLLPTLRTPPAR